MVTYIFVTDQLHIKINYMRRDVFQAIADPTRRNIIHLVAGQPMTLNAVADEFHISRPAVSKHIKILTECGLIVIRQQGRERYCRANLRPLQEVSQWVEHYRAFWTKKLDALGLFLEAEAEPAKKRKAKTRAAKKPAKPIQTKKKKT